MIYDHLLRGDDEAAMRATLPEYWVPPSDDTPDGAWRGDVCIPGAQVYVRNGDTREYFSGWFLIVSLPAVSPALRDLPGNACRLIANREAAQVVYVAPDITPGALAAAVIEPLFAGSQYTFGG